MTWRLEQPFWLVLWVLPLIVVVVLYFRRRQQTGWVDPALRPWVIVASGTLQAGPLWGLLLAWGLGVLALAHPQYGVPDAAAAQAGAQNRPLIILLDLSRSMRIHDVPPDRITAARTLAGALVASLPPGQRIGLRVFDGHSHWVVPPTRDHALIRRYLSIARVDSLPRRGGRSDWAVWETAQAVMEQNLPQPATVLLLSDGHPPYGRQAPQIPMVSSELRRAVRLLTVGIGTLSGGAIPDPARHDGLVRWRGRQIRAPLYELQLKQLTRQWQGRYWRHDADTDLSEQLEQLKQAVSSLTKTASSSHAETAQWQWHSLRSPLLAGALLLLMMTFWPIRWRRWFR